MVVYIWAVRCIPKKLLAGNSRIMTRRLLTCILVAREIRSSTRLFVNLIDGLVLQVWKLLARNCLSYYRLCARKSVENTLLGIYRISAWPFRGYEEKGGLEMRARHLTRSKLMQPRIRPKFT